MEERERVKLDNRDERGKEKIEESEEQCTEMMG